MVSYHHKRYSFPTVVSYLSNIIDISSKNGHPVISSIEILIDKT